MSEPPPREEQQSRYERMLQTCLSGELRIVNSGLPRSQKTLAELLQEEYPQVLCNDGSAHLFKRREIEYLAGMLDTKEKEALSLPMLIELSGGQSHATVVRTGAAEEKVLARTLGMPVASEQGRIVLYKPQLALLRKKLRTTTQYVFSPKITQ